jgi:hypothetical protein
VTAEVARLVEVLSSRPGRGGVRLSYGQAKRLLSIISVASTLAAENALLRRRHAQQVESLEASRDRALAEVNRLAARARGVHL